MYTEKKELFTEKISAGKRIYFLDVKENKNKEKYLIITEKQTSQSGVIKRNRVMIFEEYIDSFNNSFKKVVDFIKNKNDKLTFK